MIRVYYKADSGEITQAVTHTHATPNNTDPYILHNQTIRICDYRVDLATKSLVHEPCASEPVFRR